MSTTPIEVLLTLSLPEDALETIRQVSDRINLTVQPVRSADAITAEQWEKAEVLYTGSVLPLPEQAPKLRWVQFHYAGIDHAINAPLMQSKAVQFTTMSGAVAPQVAEHVIMMMLALGHQMRELNSLQLKTEWPADRWERLKPVELRGSTVGIVGYGSIGREIARLLTPFNVRILAAKRDAMHPEDNGYRIEETGDPQGDLFDRLYPGAAVRSMLKECDFVVVCLPLTRSTRGFINQEVLSEIKPGAFLVDVSRGGIIDEKAILAALQEKRIAAAALDVFSEEPLPPNNPLWKLPNVLISPHISGVSSFYGIRAAQMFAENLNRYSSGSPLLNEVDSELGY